MGRIEELETEIEQADLRKNSAASACSRKEQEAREQEILHELESLQDPGVPEQSDTNELP